MAPEFTPAADLTDLTVGVGERWRPGGVPVRCPGDPVLSLARSSCGFSVSEPAPGEFARLPRLPRLVEMGRPPPRGAATLGLPPLPLAWGAVAAAAVAARTVLLLEPASWRRGDCRCDDDSVLAVGTEELLALPAPPPAVAAAVAAAAAAAPPALASCPARPAERGLALEAARGACRFVLSTDLVTGLGLPLPPLLFATLPAAVVATEAWLALASIERLPPLAW